LIEDPDPEPFPPPETRRPAFAEWQCSAAAMMGQTFYEMPNGCRKAFHQESWPRYLDEKKQGDPTSVPKKDSPDPIHKFDHEMSASDMLFAKMLRSTDKKMTAEGEENPCDWDKDGTDDCAVTAHAHYERDDPIVENSAEFGGFAGGPDGPGVQLNKCLRDFFRPFFNKVQMGNWKTFSPVDDARFISGLPSFVPKDKVAITLGLYDIHYNPNKVKMNDKDSIGVIAEEIAHTVQFIGIWESVENTGIKNNSYQAAQVSWGTVYLNETHRIQRENIGKAIVGSMIGVKIPKEDSYTQNKYEKEARLVRDKVEAAVAQLKKPPCS